MTRREQKRFVIELVANVQVSMLGKLPDVPAEWDGIELRQWIADTFANQTHSMSMRAGLTAGDRKRKRDYKNEVLVRNLV